MFLIIALRKSFNNVTKFIFFQLFVEEHSFENVLVFKKYINFKGTLYDILLEFLIT